ncbi:MAG: SDR family NAD(P)-dependent oxidoreductase, partial [Cyclobacteriaceae bacterium]
MQELENKIVLITGGSKGIGYGVAEVLMREKMKIAITSRSQKAAEAAAAKLNELGVGEAMGIGADVRDLSSQEKTVERVIQRWGALDVLIANAGIGYFGSI